MAGDDLQVHACKGTILHLRPFSEAKSDKLRLLDMGDAISIVYRYSAIPEVTGIRAGLDRIEVIIRSIYRETARTSSSLPDMRVDSNQLSS